MKIVYDKDSWKEEAVVATIGFFDGVHTGHRFLLQKMQQIAEVRKLPTAVITFPVHPNVVLRAHYHPKLLNTFEEKIKLITETGIDYLIVMTFTKELAAMTARQFMATALVPEWHVQTLLVGYNHRFGSQHTEGIEQYILDGKAFGLEVIKTSSFSSDKGTAVSSSMIRRLIETGDVAAAARLLGYHYQLKGHVVEGNHIGQRLGFPTANMMVDENFKVIPKNGSYAVRITINEKNYNGMSYVGSRPSIDSDDSLRIEVHLFDFSSDIYNASIVVEFIDFIRDERKFDSLDELREQMQEDQKKAKLIVNC